MTLHDMACHDRSVEALRGDGTPLCSLPPLPDDRYFHTQSGLLACGGDTTPTSCLSLTQGRNTEKLPSVDSLRHTSPQAPGLRATVCCTRGRSTPAGCRGRGWCCWADRTPAARTPRSCSPARGTARSTSGCSTTPGR